MDYLPCVCKIHGQDHFWALNSYFFTDFQNFVALLTTFGTQKMIFAGDGSEQDDIQKGSFQRMV